MSKNKTKHKVRNDDRNCAMQDALASALNSSKENPTWLTKGLEKKLQKTTSSQH